MAKELSKNSLRTWLRYWAKYRGKILEGKELQAYKQIWRLIEGAKETVFISDEYLKKLKDKPKVSKKFVEKWAETILLGYKLENSDGTKNYKFALTKMLQDAGVEVEE